MLSGSSLETCGWGTFLQAVNRVCFQAVPRETDEETFSPRRDPASGWCGSPWATFVTGSSVKAVSCHKELFAHISQPHRKARGHMEDVRSAFSYLSSIMSIEERKSVFFVNKRMPSGISQTKQFTDDLACAGYFFSLFSSLWCETWQLHGWPW